MSLKGMWYSRKVGSLCEQLSLVSTCLCQKCIIFMHKMYIFCFHLKKRTLLKIRKFDFSTKIYDMDKTSECKIVGFRGSPHENLKKIAFFKYFLIDRKTTTKRVFWGSGGLVVSTGSSRLGINLCKFCYNLIVSYKNFEARFLKTTFFKLACRITQKVFNRLTSTTFYFVDNKQLLYMNHRYS